MVAGGGSWWLVVALNTVEKGEVRQDHADDDADADADADKSSLLDADADHFPFTSPSLPFGL